MLVGFTIAVRPISADPDSDQFFYRGIDEKTKYKTESVICVPLRVESEVIRAIICSIVWVRKITIKKDLQLLEIFAQTISSSIVNAVDAQRAQDLARRDDLTGLYNDRFSLSVVGGRERRTQSIGLLV
ncbi:MAG: hypothetical protein R3C68_16645 [Myxococcota bacterium]